MRNWTNRNDKFDILPGRLRVTAKAILLILSLETSTRRAEIALLDSEISLGTYRLKIEETATRDLVRQMERLMAEHDRAASQLDLVAVSIGPGSFTGLRIGVTVAKTLAFATGCSLAGIDTLQVIAWQARHVIGTSKVAVLTDAQRGEFFCAEFDVQPDVLPRRLGEVRIIPGADAISLVDSVDYMIVDEDRIRRAGVSNLPSEKLLSDSEQVIPRATTAGRLGLEQYQQGVRTDFWSLVPKYVRRSAAAEKLGGGANAG